MFSVPNSRSIQFMSIQLTFIQIAFLLEKLSLTTLQISNSGRKKLPFTVRGRPIEQDQEHVSDAPAVK